MKLGEFFIDLLVDAGKGELTVGNLVKQFGELEAVSLAEIGILWELGSRLASVSDQAIQTALGMERLGAETGTSGEEWNRWSIRAKLAHSSGESLKSAVQGITSGLAKLRMGAPGGDSMFGGFSFLHLLPDKLDDAYSIIEKIRKNDTFKQLNQPQKEQVLGMFHIPPDLILLLDKTDDQLAAMDKSAHGMSKGQEQLFLQMQDKILKIELAARDIMTDLAAWAAPTIIRDLERVLELVGKIEPFIKSMSPDEKNLTPEQRSDREAGRARSEWMRGILQGIGGFFEGAREAFPPSPRTPGSSFWEPAPSPGAVPVPLRREAPRGASTTHNTFKISGAQDPHLVATIVEEHLGRMNDEAEWQLDRGPVT